MGKLISLKREEPDFVFIHRMKKHFCVFQNDVPDFKLIHKIQRYRQLLYKNEDYKGPEDEVELSIIDDDD